MSDDLDTLRTLARAALEEEREEAARVLREQAWVRREAKTAARDALSAALHGASVAVLVERMCAAEIGVASMPCVIVRINAERRLERDRADGLEEVLRASGIVLGGALSQSLAEGIVGCVEDHESITILVRGAEIRLTVPEAVDMLRALSQCAIVRRDLAAELAREAMRLRALREALASAVQQVDAAVQGLEGRAKPSEVP